MATPSSADLRWQQPMIISMAARVPGVGSALSASSREIPASSRNWYMMSTWLRSPDSSSMKFSSTTSASPCSRFATALTAM